MAISKPLSVFLSDLEINVLVVLKGENDSPKGRFLDDGDEVELRQKPVE